MTAVVILAAAAIAGVAVAGVIRPLGRGRAASVEAPDPLDDERAALLHALRDLDRDRAIGAIPQDEYAALRSETETRAVAVLRAIEARDGQGTLASDIRELRPSEPVGPARRSWWALGGAVLVAVLVLLATGAVRSRTADQSITGSQPTDPLAFFEERVKDHPNDLAARLDLADRYLAAGNVEDAIAQYLSALKLNPDNPEARATLGFLLYKAGKPEDGLDQVNRALQTSPNDPESLYFKGVILLDALHRPAQAAQALQAYLDAAPFGARRTEVQRLLAEAREARG